MHVVLNQLPRMSNCNNSIESGESRLYNLEIGNSHEVVETTITIECRGIIN